MKSTLSIKWSCENNAAYDLLDRTYEHLDKRKKAYRDVEQTKRVLSSLLAQRMGPFVVSYADVPKKDKETLREALECLSGPVLTRGKGRSEYSLRDEYTDPQATFCTPNPEVTGKRRRIPSEPLPPPRRGPMPPLPVICSAEHIDWDFSLESLCDQRL